MWRAPTGVPVMRIVADTNTVLSGLLWQGPPRRLIDLAREHAVTLCTSSTLLAEVIARDKFAHRVLAAGLSATESCRTRPRPYSGAVTSILKQRLGIGRITKTLSFAVPLHLDSRRNHDNRQDRNWQ